MSAFGTAHGSFGILFAEDFDDDEGAAVPTIDSDDALASAPRAETAPAAEASFTLADLAEARRLAHEAGYAAGIADAAGSATTARNAIAAAIASQLTAARADMHAAVTSQLDGVARATIGLVSACLPVLCERAGTADMLAVLRDLLPALIDEPGLVVTVHPDQAAVVETDLAGLPGGAAATVATSAALGRSDVEVSWKSGTAARSARALRREIKDMLRRSLDQGAARSDMEDHRHGR